MADLFDGSKKVSWADAWWIVGIIGTAAIAIACVLGG